MLNKKKENGDIWELIEEWDTINGDACIVTCRWVEGGARELKTIYHIQYTI